MRDVPAWLADSRLTEVVYHRTDVESAAAIREHGVDVGQSRRALYIQGFYTTVGRGDPSFGPAEVVLAIKMHAPFVTRTGRVLGDVARVLAEVGEDDVSAVGVRRALLRRGYDGVIIERPDGPAWAIGLRADRIRVIVDPP